MLPSEDTASSYAAYERELLRKAKQLVRPLLVLLITVLASLVADRLQVCYAGCQLLLSTVELLCWLLAKCAPTIGALLGVWVFGSMLSLLLMWSMGDHPL